MIHRRRREAAPADTRAKDRPAGRTTTEKELTDIRAEKKRLARAVATAGDDIPTYPLPGWPGLPARAPRRVWAISGMARLDGLTHGELAITGVRRTQRERAKQAPDGGFQLAKSERLLTAIARLSLLHVDAALTAPHTPTATGRSRYRAEAARDAALGSDGDQPTVGVATSRLTVERAGMKLGRAYPQPRGNLPGRSPEPVTFTQPRENRSDLASVPDTIKSSDLQL